MGDFLQNGNAEWLNEVFADGETQMLYQGQCKLQVDGNIWADDLVSRPAELG